ncbi:MAG: lycopene cyclase domain-containing protein [Candidatus Nomurabacteria bacterium]|nr:MAG: lycopene cyclase domain-containing protein [Candidatus Nomurabacteria bacterium]
MATYVVLNLVVMALVLTIARVRLSKLSRAVVATMVVLLVLTAVFDNAIVGLSIVDYDPHKILGLRIGVAPIEDFMYALLAAIIVPTIWHKLGEKHV